MTELATLEGKRLSDLHQIASQLGIEQYRKYRKPELAQKIYQVATEQAATQQTARVNAPSQRSNGASQFDNGSTQAAAPATASAGAQELR